MKGYRFYEEFTNTRKHTSQGNVIARELGTEDYYLRIGQPGLFGAVAAIFNYSNSPATFTTVHFRHLHKCKRISEERAREIHPNLFTYLEQGD